MYLIKRAGKRERQEFEALLLPAYINTKFSFKLSNGFGIFEVTVCFLFNLVARLVSARSRVRFPPGADFVLNE
jgi:hypothetical protein